MKKLRQKLVYILKHNSCAQKMYRIIFSTLFRFVGCFARNESNLVIFTSMMGSRYNDSPKSIYEYMKKREEYRGYKLLWAFEEPELYPDVPAVRIDTPKFFWTLLKAGYWVSNTNIQRGLSFKNKKTKWMYCCHGTAIKLCGNDCPGRKDFDYSTADFILVQSKFDEKVMRHGYNARPESFLECGRPCSDELFHATHEQYLAMRKKLRIPENKKVILYAPTWRDSNDGGTSYAIKPPIDFQKWERKLGEDYVILFRAHHITTKIMDVEFNSFVWNVSDYPEINELMIASDMLISDYSAVLTDYSILRRPVFCFAYDYDEYLKNRGTYFELDEKLPNKSCRTEDELLEKILSVDYETEAQNTERFRKLFIEFGGNATEQAVKAMFG